MSTKIRILIPILTTALLVGSVPLFSQDKARLAFADSLRKEGYGLYRSKQYVDAVRLLEKSAAIQKAQSGDNTPRFAHTLYYIGCCYDELDHYAKAMDYLQQALDVQRAVHGKDHSEYANVLVKMGRCYRNIGDSQTALEYYLSALGIQEKTVGKTHSGYARNLNDIGRCYKYLGDIGNALEYHQQALELQAQTKGRESLDYALTLDNIGGCYFSLGNVGKALEYYQQSLDIKEKNLDPDTPGIALSLGRIARCYKTEDGDRALDYYRKSLAILEKVYGKDSPEYARGLSNIGNCFYDQNDIDNALAYYRDALAILGKRPGQETVRYASGLVSIGQCYYKRYDIGKALMYYRQALDIRERVQGRNNPGYAANLSRLARCCYDLGDYADASAYLGTYSELSSAQVTRSFSSLTESQRNSFWRRYSEFYTNKLYEYAVTISSPEMNCTAFDGALLGKGLLLNAETQMRKLILESGDKEALRMYNEIQERRVRLDKLYKDEASSGKKALIDSLNNDLDLRQQALTRRSRAFGDYTRNLALKWTDVQAALGKYDTAIEFETFTHRDTTFYIALSLRPGYTGPHLTELFSSEDLKKADAPSYEDTGMKDYYRSAEITKLVWGRLEGELKGVRNVYFSPAGELNNIGIEYMMDADGKHLLSDLRDYYRLTSTRELVRERKPARMTDVTVYGGVKYDIPTGSQSPGRGKGEVLEYLYGSEREARSIAGTLTSVKVHNDLLMGEAGTEDSFKALSASRKDVIHIATHGFFRAETKESEWEESSSLQDDETMNLLEDKALSLSGLYFAGAQNTLDGRKIPFGAEDGILTAAEISRMDLRGTHLVVLSACQSGLGEVTGDGVFGLQRGFKKAGVQSIVMSLWKVSDDITNIMMTRFYENLAKGRPKYDSFRDARDYLRKLYDDPEYYAAFVLLDAIK